MIRTLASLLLLLALTVLLANPLGQIPALGPVLHPVTGVIANADRVNPPAELTYTLDGLQDSVQVWINDRGVPHVFAKNDPDLYLVQGFVTARDRLFQLELQTKASNGTLHKWLGEDILPYDRTTRRIGMTYGAEQTHGEVVGSEMEPLLQAYSDGINAWIAQLRPSDYPLEYKLLGIEPGPWEPIHVSNFLMAMTRTLAGGSNDLTATNTMAHFRADFMEDYVWGESRWGDPFITPERSWTFNPLRREAPETVFAPEWVQEIEPYQPVPGIGSNNWALSGEKTASGHAMLAGDPHLNLTLPSIWYEMQLSAPGVNRYGVTFPGAPNIVMGFSEATAWMNTNTGADVQDWYVITYKDSTRQQYLFEGEWREVETRLERYEWKDGRQTKTLVDTVRYTHHGPVVYDRQFKGAGDSRAAYEGLAMRWIGHYPSNEGLVYHRLNRATTVEESIEALSTFKAPGQNYAVIDSTGDIAMIVAGKLPIRWPGQGFTLSDGASAAYEWDQWIPYEHMPLEVNPERGYVASANQWVVSDSYPYDIGNRFAPFERGKRLDDVLGEASGWTLQEMMDLQLDNANYLAEVAMPSVFESLEAERAQLSELEASALDAWLDWSLENRADEMGASLWSRFWPAFREAVWNDEYEGVDAPMLKPTRDLTAELLVDHPESSFFDNVNTPDRVESSSDQVLGAFKVAVASLAEEANVISDSMDGIQSQNPTTWLWEYFGNVHVPHLAQIDALGRFNLGSNGGDESVNAVDEDNGPSWRMVVELSPEGPTAYGVFPGGPSGNPGSALYDSDVDRWAEGGYHKLELLQAPPSAERVAEEGWRVLHLHPDSVE